MNKSRITTMFLSFSLLIGLVAAGPLATPTQAASLKVCGEVQIYVKATAVTAGALTIGVTPLVIAAGTVLDSDIKVGANLCLALTLDASGSITGALVSANVTSSVDICGKVTAFVKATASATGTITIAGRTLTIAVGAVLPSSIDVGDDLCIDFTLDGFGRVTRASVQANATTTLSICGKISAYT
nr:hypothetical protein [Chloroflexota bacterium]